MHRIIKRTQRGFTLIELMIVVAIIGILAAVAIPQFLKMMAKSKTSEGQLTLDLIKKANKAQWTENTGFVAGTAAVLPADGTVGAGCTPGTSTTPHKCVAAPDDWDADAVWSALDVKIDQDNYFVYDYVGAADGSTATADAYGDLNGNSTAGQWRLTGTKDLSGGPVFVLDKPGVNGTTAD